MAAVSLNGTCSSQDSSHQDHIDDTASYLEKANVPSFLAGVIQEIIPYEDFRWRWYVDAISYLTGTRSILMEQ